MIVNHTVPNNEAILRRTLRIAYRVHTSAKQIAIKNGGLCVSEKYINIRTPLQWKCAKDHIWFTPLKIKVRDALNVLILGVILLKMLNE